MKLKKIGLWFVSICIVNSLISSDQSTPTKASVQEPTQEAASNSIIGKIPGLGSIGESIKNKIRSYFYGIPTIQGTEVFNDLHGTSAFETVCNNDLCAIDRSLAMDFGLTHMSEETSDGQASDSYKNLIIPWRGFCTKTSVRSVQKSEKVVLPTQIIFQFGPENPSSIGNFIFSLLLNGDLSTPAQKWYSKLNSISFNTTARGFFGDQSGVLKNIELVVQLGCTYDLVNGFSRYNFQRYNVEGKDKEVYLAAVVGEHYFVFESLLGLFYQHNSNRFRAGVFWTNNNQFNTSKSSHIFASDTKKEALKDFKTEFGQKLDEIALNTTKEMAFCNSFAVLCEANFFNGRLAFGGLLESSNMILPNIKERQNNRVSTLCLWPYIKFAFARKISESRSVLCQGSFGVKNYFNNNSEERKLLGRSLSFGCQLSF